MAASIAPCCGNVLVGSHPVHRVPIYLELQFGRGRVTRMREKTLNAAGHQTEGPPAVTCKLACYQGCTENAGAVCSAAEQALGDHGEPMLPWQLSKERVLFQGIRNGIQTAPWVTRAKPVQPKWRGLMPGSGPVGDGSTCRLSLGVREG